MPRAARNNIPGVIYHVISNFVDGSWMLRDDTERRYYLQALGRALLKSDWLCFAYALMSSHIHLAFIAGTMSLESWAKPVHTGVAQWLNNRYDRRGPVFCERPQDFAVPSSHEIELVAYIHNNPVKARVVARASESTWTSHAAYLGTAPCPAWLHARESLARMNLDASAFDGWVTARHSNMSQTDLAEVRRVLRGRGAINIATPIVGAHPVVPLVARPFATVRTDPRLLVRVVSEVVGVPVATLSGRHRTATVAAARRIAFHCGRALGLAISDVAAVLGISRQRGSAIGLTTLDGSERQSCEHVLARLEVELAGR